MATTSKEINLAQLDKELGGKGLLGDFNDEYNKIILPAENSNVTEAQLEAGIATHKPFNQAATDKVALLAKLGITADEAKLLLS